MVTDAEHNPASCKRFVNLVLDADITVAAMQFFGMENMTDLPTKHIFGPDNNKQARVVRMLYLHRVLREFVLTYIIDGSLYEKHFRNFQALQDWEQTQDNQPVLCDGRYPCRSPGCTRSFKYDGVHRRRHELTHNPPPHIPEEPQFANAMLNITEPNSEGKDDVYDYHCGFMNMALLLRNFTDANREGDGDRLIQCIKIFLLHFRQDGTGSQKYALEALYHQFQLKAMLTPREAERVKWNRPVNNKGGEGNNVAMDLDLEHDNHLLKEMIRGLGANMSEESVKRVSRAFFVLKELFERLDKEMHVKKESGEHTRKSVQQDFKVIVHTLIEHNVFLKQSRDPQSYFVDCPRDYLQLLDTKALYKWINDHKKNISLDKRPR